MRRLSGGIVLSYLPLLVYVHVLLMVFWVGTDVGVFLSALRYIDPKRPLVERAACMSLGAVIDRFPRVCFVAMLPLGVTISSLLGMMPLSRAALGAVWGVSAVWMVIVIRLMVLGGGPQSRPWAFAERLLLVCYGLAFIGLAAAGFEGRLPIPGWLAGKFICYSAICSFALLLDHSFPAVVTAFTEIESQGSTARRESQLRSRMYRSLFWVLAIYAGVLSAGYLGVVKP
jgi:hypothetical protein